MLLNCGVGEDSWESLGLQGDPTSPFKGDQPWVFFGTNDAKAETPVLWPPHAKSCLIRKDSDAGRDWGQEEKGTTEDEMAGWHHWFDGCESEWTPEVGDGQGGLVCCLSWDRKESDTTERLNWTELSTHILDLADSLPVMLFNPNPFYFCKVGVEFRGFVRFRLYFQQGSITGGLCTSCCTPPVSLLTMSDMICGVEVLLAGTIH